ncbi:reverse transcriptase domain-containing protein [Tanacetum coccineum]
MPPKGMSAAAITKLVADKVAKALAADRATRENLNVSGGSGGNGGQGGAPPIRECTFVGFMKCGPSQFHSNEGAVELYCWFEKTESVFRISECAKRSKMMMEEFCLSEEIQRLENELRSLKLRDTDIAASTQRFNELALLCPEAVPTEKKKVELYIKGLPKNIKRKQLPLGLWSYDSRRGPKFTWEREDFFKNKYPHLFSNKKKASMRNRAPGRRSCKEGRM